MGGLLLKPSIWGRRSFGEDAQAEDVWIGARHEEEPGAGRNPTFTHDLLKERPVQVVA